MPKPATDRLFMWAGGKSKLIPHYRPFLPDALNGRPYVEPFAGGAALFADFSSREQVQGTLSDVNNELISLYQLVRDDPDFLISEMQSRDQAWMRLAIQDRKALYYDLRQEYWDMPEGRHATALLYFLMKTGFNGIWQTCKASRGRFGTPAGLATQKLTTFSPRVITQWSRMLQGMSLTCCGYQDVEVGQGAFVFCDPPYRDSFTTYGTNFDDRAQEDLIAWCRHVHETTGSTVWLSNRDAGDGFFERLAPDAMLRRFPVTYTAGRRKKTADGYEAKPAIEVLLIWG